jgi:hypothetical protein
MNNLGKDGTYERLNKDYEKEIQDVARTSWELRQAGLRGDAWYCCLLVRLGEMLISFGTRLKAHYSPRATLRIR